MERLRVGLGQVVDEAEGVRRCEADETVLVVVEEALEVVEEEDGRMVEGGIGRERSSAVIFRIIPFIL